LHSRLLPASTPTCQTRSYPVYKKPPPIPKSAFDPAKVILDERIGSRTAHLVTENGFQAAEPLASLLRDIDRGTSHLRKVGETEEGIPVVKLVTIDQLREELKTQKKVVVKQKKGDTSKQVELNWAITENDLGYRLTRIEQFLKEGRRVEVMIAPKRGGRRATKEEIDGLLATMRQTIADVEGGSEEWKKMEGTVGAQVTMFFQPKDEGGKATAEKVAKKREEREERLTQKEEDKAEKKRKLEKRLAKKKGEEDREEKERKEKLNLSVNS